MQGISSRCYLVYINSGFRAFNFLLDGGVKLQIPDFNLLERDLENGPLDAESDEEMRL